MHPGKGQRAIGLGIERLPDVRLLAEVGQARIHGDELVGVHGHVHRLTAGIVVVRHLGGAAPAHHDLGLIHRGLPAEGVGRVHQRGKVARALAHLVGRHAVGTAEQKREHAVGAHAPAAARARHHHDGLAAELVHDLAVFLGHGGVGLVPADAHPTRIVGILGVGALQGVQHAVGMVSRLDRRLRLSAAIAA